MKLSSDTVNAYGGKLLELKHHESEVEVVFSKCKSKHQGVLSVKGEKDKRVLHSPREGENGEQEFEVLYVGDCKKTTEGLFHLSGVEGQRANLEPYRQDGKTLFPELLFEDIEGEEKVAMMEESNKYWNATYLQLKVTKYLQKM